MKTVGSPGDDHVYSTQRTSDGGSIVAGSISGFGAGGQDVLLVKFDGSGAIQWANTVGGPGNDYALSVRQTSDGGYIVTGYTFSLIPDTRVLLLKLNGAGALQWTSILQRTSGGSAGESVEQTNDGGYIVTGYPDGALGGLGLFKYDASGQLQWVRRASGTNHNGTSVQQTSDGGYIVTGAKQGNVYDVTLLKFDGAGDLQWAQLAYGSAYDHGEAVQQTSDGGYVVAGGTASFGAGGQDVLLLKYDGFGALQWARTAGGTADDAATSVRQTSDGGYIVSGYTRSFVAGATLLFLIKFDSSGAMQWAKAGGGSTSGTSVQQTSDGGYLVAGSTTGFSAGGSDVLLIRTDANGDIAGCADWLSVSPSIGTSFQSEATSWGVDSPGLSATVATLSVVAAPLTSNVQCMVNTAPTLAANTSLVTVQEGQTAANTGTYSDPNSGDDVAVSASVGTGTKTGTNSGTWSWSFATTDGPAQSQTVTITANDGNGGITTTDFALSVTNVPPVITGVTGPAGPLALGTAATVSANFTDAGTLDTHTCSFSWDDGTNTPPSLPTATVSETNGSGSCSATHTYSAAGVYTVQVSVKDKDNATATGTFEFVVVYDSSAEFVTGGGWINSPAGAYTPEPSLSGKATFGFVSKYQRGATVPTGRTEFQFHVASFNFHSSVYEWLVVAGARAQYKGSGTINGAGNYNFLLTATDGQQPGGGGVDKFRIKIWGSGGLIYDNVGGSDDIDSADPQAISGGSIVIHSR